MYFCEKFFGDIFIQPARDRRMNRVRSKTPKRRKSYSFNLNRLFFQQINTHTDIHMHCASNN